MTPCVTTLGHAREAEQREESPAPPMGNPQSAAQWTLFIVQMDTHRCHTWPGHLTPRVHDTLVLYQGH